MEYDKEEQVSKVLTGFGNKIINDITKRGRNTDPSLRNK